MNKELGNPLIPASSDIIIRISALISPIVLIAYAILANKGVINVPYQINQTGIIILLGSLVFAAIIQFFTSTTSKIDLMFRFSAFWIASGAFFIFYSAFTNPLIVLWIALIASCYSRLSTFGIQLSFFYVILSIVFDSTLWNKDNPTLVGNNLVVVLGILITSTVITLIFHRYQKNTNLTINQGKERENLQKDRVLTIVNNMADAVISTDIKGIINVNNAASLNLLDTNKSLIGRNIKDVLPLKDREGNEVHIFDELQTAKKVSRRDDLIYSFSSDDKMRLEITYAPIRKSYSDIQNNEGYDGYILIMRDVTKQKSLEEERDEFVSVVSHELRTPITIAEGTISNVRAMMDHPDIKGAMLKDAIDVAHQQVIYLANMVNDLSALSRAERGVADTPEDIDVTELAHNLYNKYLEEAKKKKLNLNLSLTPSLGHILASRLYIEELLQNLMTNALKYTKEGEIEIICEQKGDKITFAIKDSGIGISKSDQTKIFQKFFRSEDYRTRETGGTGLGLYIAMKLAHQLGTKVELSSRLNYGSTFSFILPVFNTEKDASKKPE